MWTTVINEKLVVFMKPDNEVDVVMDHLHLRKNGKFAKMIFYFLRADHYATCEVKPKNLSDGNGIQVPHNLFKNHW